MNIYTDIDYVLHDYTESFLLSLQEFKGITQPPIPYKNYEDYLINITESLSPYIFLHNLNYEDLTEMFKIANKSFKWNPTPFSKEIIKFAKKRYKMGDEIIAITARSELYAARHITSKCFGFDIPVIGCETRYKYLAMQNNSVYFEDHAESVENVLNYRKNMCVICPKWPWNIDFRHDSEYFYHLEHHEFKNLNSIVENFILKGEKNERTVSINLRQIG